MVPPDAGGSRRVWMQGHGDYRRLQRPVLREDRRLHSPRIWPGIDAELVG